MSREPEPEPEGLRRVVAAIDFSPSSDRALAWAACQAARRGAELHLVHAVETYGGMDMTIPAGRIETVRGHARGRLAELTKDLRQEVRSVVATAEVGAPDAVILDAAKALRPELLVMGTRGLRGWEHAMLGSTAQRVLGGAGCPVLAVHATDAMPPARSLRVLAASDGSEDSLLAIRTAAQLFDLEPAAVLVHAFQYPPVFYAGTGGMSSYDFVAESRAAAMERLVGEAATLAGEGIDARPMLRDGFPPDAIVAAAEALPADLVVMGSRGRGGLAHLLLGSTAERVVQRASMPVLVVPHRAARILDELATTVAVGGAPLDEQC